MRITVYQDSRNIVELVGKNKWEELVANKDGLEYELTIQNLGNTDIYLEIGDEATVENGYLLKKGNEVEITMNRINQINLVSDGSVNDNIRIITT